MMKHSPFAKMLHSYLESAAMAALAADIAATGWTLHPPSNKSRVVALRVTDGDSSLRCDVPGCTRTKPFQSLRGKRHHMTLIHPPKVLITPKGGKKK